MTHCLNITSLVAALLIAALACVPRPVGSELGPGWQCSQNLLVTSCRHASLQ